MGAPRVEVEEGEDYHLFTCRCELCRALRPKPYHYAAAVDDRGRVSPLCSRAARPLNLARELWTLRPEAVTCERCRELLTKAGGG